jgi:hypothetical protein
MKTVAPEFIERKLAATLNGNQDADVVGVGTTSSPQGNAFIYNPTFSSAFPITWLRQGTLSASSSRDMAKLKIRGNWDLAGDAFEFLSIICLALVTP